MLFPGARIAIHETADAHLELTQKLIEADRSSAVDDCGGAALVTMTVTKIPAATERITFFIVCSLGLDTNRTASESRLRQRRGRRLRER
jgi:hypothetical protein